MLIRDLEVKSGLDRATIRYYEREGLITPEREENGYRNYTQENLDHLLKIKLLRQLGMRIERIKSVQQGSADLQAVLSEQIRILEHQIREAQQARLVCLQMQNDRVCYADLDVHHYLNVLQGPQIAPVKKEFRERVYRDYHPFRRLLARWMDYAIISQLIDFLLVAVLRIRPFPDWISTLIGYAVPFLMVPLGALMLHLCGTTPGKWCLGLHVDSENGGKLTFSSALDREWDVLRYGLGFGIPIWSLWCLYRSYRDYREQEPDWDWESEYCYKKWSISRKLAAGALAAVWVLLVLICSNSLILPKYRGDLTVSGFSSNYNHYLELLEDDYRGTRLQEDGLYPPELQNSVTVYVFGEPEKKNYSFDYSTEGDRLRKISYSNSWTGVISMDVIPDQCMIAALTAVMSQKGADKSTLTEFAQLWDEEMQNQSGRIVCNGVNISWHTEADNCAFSYDGVWHTTESEENGVVFTEFVIELP